MCYSSDKSKYPLILLFMPRHYLCEAIAEVYRVVLKCASSCNERSEQGNVVIFTNSYIGIMIKTS